MQDYHQKYYKKNGCCLQSLGGLELRANVQYDRQLHQDTSGTWIYLIYLQIALSQAYPSDDYLSSVSYYIAFANYIGLKVHGHSEETNEKVEDPSALRKITHM